MGLKELLFNFLVCLIPCVTLTSSCEDITGRWRNDQGAEVKIDHLPSGILQGKYYRAVSLSRVEVSGHEIVGTLPYDKPGSSFAFSVTWQNGSSTKVWTGQCQVCDGKELLETSWLLRSFVGTCLDKWKSTLIGKDVFKRVSKADKSGSNTVAKTPPDVYSGHKCDLRGVWYNEVGSEVILNQTKDGVITGEYRTAVEREHGSAGQTHSLVYGSSAFGNPNTTFSLIVVWKGGASVTGWVGQCHICANNTAILEMSWLLRSRVDSCDDVWKSTMYSVNSFTRHEQKSGPRKTLGKHTPNRDGESVDGGSSTKVAVSHILLTIAFSYSWLVH